MRATNNGAAPACDRVTATWKIVEDNEQPAVAWLRRLRPVSVYRGVAATHFYRAQGYHLNATGGMVLSDDDMVDLLCRWVNQYPILSIEDGMAEDWYEDVSKNAVPILMPSTAQSRAPS